MKLTIFQIFKKNCEKRLHQSENLNFLKIKQKKPLQKDIFQA